MNSKSGFRLLWLIIFATFIRSADTCGQQISPSDTANTDQQARLQEVEVTGYESRRPRYATAGGISVINSRQLHGFSNQSLVPALNLEPGVQMEERSPGSYRLSIRGSTLRSPYGVRNVKVYWNGIPFTDASGNTALNLIDPKSLGRIEILKGPSGSLFGAGTGGTVLLESPRQAINTTSAELFAQAGSFGSYKYGATAGTATQESSLQAMYLRQQSDGWREQTALDRHQVQLNYHTKVSAKRQLAVHTFFTKLYYELPGGLTRQQFLDNPKQARPQAITQKSSFNINSVFTGLSHTWQITDSLSNVTSVYGNAGFVVHPFITDYERNTQLGAGGRSTFQYRSKLLGQPLKLLAGAEYQRSFTASRVYDNAGGEPDSLRLDDEVTVQQMLVFAQADGQLSRSTNFTVGLSINQLHFGFWRHTNQASQLSREFKPVLSPRVAVVQQLTTTLAVQASVSSGFSPPTEPEIRTSEGSLNLDLEPERGINYELGLRGGSGRRFQYEANFYLLQLREGIVGHSLPSGVVLFRNTGKIEQQGIEVSAEYSLGSRRTENGGYSFLSAPALLFVNYAWQRGRFKTYTSGDNNLSGMALTGLSPHTASAGLDIRFRHRIQLFLTGNYTDAAPLTDNNSIYSDSYWLLAMRLSYTQLIKQTELQLYAGSENLLDQQYSLGNDLNAFGGRYFNPAPPRSFYAGLALKFGTR